jgi:hypothetical protein
VFVDPRHPLVRRLWFSFALTVIGAIALAVLGDWVLFIAALVLLGFEVRTIRSFGRKIAALEQAKRN